MVKLNAEVKEAFLKSKVIPLATASKDNVPNVAPMASLYLKDDETIWILNNYMNKTATNIKETKKAAVYIYGEGIKGCFQIKGDAELISTGADYEEAKKMFLAKKPNFPAKELLIIKITDVFNCSPGQGAGDKIL
ncbi:pyridoxamine 5'-phosphate oxidase family protein [Methanomicrobium antiquum]|uniref:Pyridoxamine 5'-phosphate oxidase family protein n=1 Tax=Methanomicrobium antiquum TaxID=487686 RepID=A0AAF0FRL6_9EURY|nr:pyridoxamine 5'-phosphate oxidase family protein [Methanomicrobium antiquum]MDD3978083.1 pyridoxamine 5'-phosphate oxidase family protein [Methanomicrobium sp.]WFN36576.1 pyridoxamine 5'-phosphate oxidase family protein [Methanomicrobium antiquum]